MAYTPRVLFETGYPSNSGGILYTVPNGANVIIKNIVLTNTTGNEATVTLNVVASGSSAQASNRILSSFAVPSHGVSTMDCSIVMKEGSYIYGLNGTNNAVTLTISGVEIS